jgi:hypothetical protein
MPCHHRGAVIERLRRCRGFHRCGLLESRRLDEEVGASGREAEIDGGQTFAGHLVLGRNCHGVDRMAEAEFEQLRFVFGLQTAGSIDLREQWLCPRRVGELWDSSDIFFW